MTPSQILRGNVAQLPASPVKDRLLANVLLVESAEIEATRFRRRLDEIVQDERERAAAVLVADAVPLRRVGARQ